MRELIMTNVSRNQQQPNVRDTSFDSLGNAVVTPARARVSSEYHDATELQAMRHAATRIKKFANHALWGQKRHHEAILLAAALRAAERATAHVGGHRVKLGKGLWVVRATTPTGDVDLIQIERPMRRHLADFDRQVNVTVLQPALVDTLVLDTWVRCKQMGLSRPRRRRPPKASTI